MPKFNLKSGKDLFDVEQAAEETYEDFQAKVFALTDIPPKNLKVLFKGKMIKVKIPWLLRIVNRWRASPKAHN